MPRFIGVYWSGLSEFIGAMQDNKPTKPTEQEVTDEKRRELVKKLGKIAVYTPPAMLALMVSPKATAQSQSNAIGT